MFVDTIIPGVEAMEAEEDEKRAAIVMWGGIWAHFDVSVIVWITGYERAFVQRCAMNLSSGNIWQKNMRTIHCEWLDDTLPAFQREVGFWCDVLVALGKVRRTTDVEGQFLYQVA